MRNHLRTQVTRVTRVAAVVAACVALVATGGAASAHGGHGGPGGHDSGPRHHTALTARQRHLVYDATKQFRRPQAAVAAGYVQVSECTELPGVGGMGVHYIHPALAGDDVVDPRKPELLVYVPQRDGSLRLGAVEYFVADSDQDASTDEDRPSLFGRYPFEGPMAGHEPGMPVHYDLHVWLYKHNPAGQLASWNPRVTCAA